MIRRQKDADFHVSSSSPFIQLASIRNGLRETTSFKSTGEIFTRERDFAFDNVGKAIFGLDPNPLRLWRITFRLHL